MEESQDWQGDEILASPGRTSKRQSPPPHYGDAAFMEEQKLLIDLIPQRLTGVGVLLLTGLGVIAGLIGLHYWASSAAVHYPEGTLRALNLAAAGNLAQWFSCLLLLAATGASVLVYSIRRQRNDDYHGRYRVWLWAALCWFLFATDVAVGLNGSLQKILVHLTGTPLWKDGVLWWILPYTVIFAALGSRLVLDMWPSRLAIAAFALAATGYLAALLAGLGILPENLNCNVIMVHAGAIMLGHLMLLLSMLLQARYVVLDFEGQLPQRKAKPAKPKKIILKKSVVEEEEEEEIDSDNESWHRVDSPQGTPQPVLRRAGTTATPVFTPIDDDSDDDGLLNPTNRKLTKQEKKALKARLLRERAEREKKQSKW
jgi:hypothetical protein